MLASLPGKERNSPPYFVSQAENRAVSMSNPTEVAVLLGSRTKPELLLESRLSLLRPRGNDVKFSKLLCVWVVGG